MYTYTHHVQPKSAIRINVNYMYYSERWISGADSLRTSNISDHAHSDQFTSCVTILSSISTCNLKGVTGVVPWIRINGRSISKIGHAKYSLIGHLANQTSWLILCTGSVFQNCEQELHLMKLRSRFQLQVTMVSVDELSRSNAVVLVSPPTICPYIKRRDGWKLLLCICQKSK